jgi:hypothetical protein
LSNRVIEKLNGTGLLLVALLATLAPIAVIAGIGRSGIESSSDRAIGPVNCSALPEHSEGALPQRLKPLFFYDFAARLKPGPSEGLLLTNGCGMSE